MGNDGPTFDKLTPNNWMIWKERARAYLKRKNVWSKFVATAPVTGVTTRSEAAKEAGKVAGGSEVAVDDDMALAYLVECVSDYYVPMVAACRTAAEAWGKLEAQFAAQSTARVVYLLKQAATAKKSPGESILDYVSRVTSYRDGLEVAGFKMPESTVVLYILAGLPREYESLITMIESDLNDLKIDAIQPRLLQVEQRWDPDASSDDDQALMGAMGGFTKGGYGKKGRGGKGKQNVPKCWKCGEIGHVKAKCPQNTPVATTSFFAMAPAF
jgi:gag-polypeptide of LTR copia-type/Zinc knuckle